MDYLEVFAIFVLVYGSIGGLVMLMLLVLGWIACKGIIICGVWFIFFMYFQIIIRHSTQMIKENMRHF